MKISVIHRYRRLLYLYRTSCKYRSRDAWSRTLDARKRACPCLKITTFRASVPINFSHVSDIKKILPQGKKVVFIIAATRICEADRNSDLVCETFLPQSIRAITLHSLPTLKHLFFPLSFFLFILSFEQLDRKVAVSVKLIWRYVTLRKSLFKLISKSRNPWTKKTGRKGERGETRSSRRVQRPLLPPRDRWTSLKNESCPFVKS